MGVVSLGDLSSARFSFLFNLAPFITAIISYLFFAERLRAKKIIGLIIGFLGFLPLLLVGNVAHVNSASFLSVPGLQAIVSTIAYAYGWIVIRELVKRKNYAVPLVIGIALMCGGLGILLTSLMLEGWSSSPVFYLFPSLAYLTAIIFVGEIISTNLYASLLRRYTATFLSFAGFLYPLFGALFGWFFLHERITWNFLASSCIVLVGLYIFYLEELQNTGNNRYSHIQ